MGAFGGLIQTKKGRNLQAKAELGAELVFTRMAIGDGQLSGQSIPDLNGLISEKKSLPITRKKIMLPSQAVIGAVLSNQDVTTGFYFREIGIFAQDPDEGEILYAYGNSGSGAEYIPPAGTADIIEKTIDMIVTFGQAQNVSAVINSSLVYATPDDVAAGVTEAKDYTDQKVSVLETPAGEATGTVVNGNTAYTAQLSPAPTTLKKFMRVVVKVNVASTGSPTFDFNGLGAKAALKANGSPASFKANGVYSLVYDGTAAFILQGEGGEVGTATAADVLAGKTIPGEDGLIIGTMPNLTGVRNATGTAKWPDGGLAVYPEKGYQKGGVGDGEIKVSTAQLQAAESALASANIKSGANIFGVPGKASVVDTADAVLDPQYLLVEQSGYANGVKKPGTMPNRSAENFHMPGLDSTAWAGDRVFIKPPRGFYDGESWVTAPAPGLTSANVRRGVNILGINGDLATPVIQPINYLPGNVGVTTKTINDFFIIPANTKRLLFAADFDGTNPQCQMYGSSGGYLSIAILDQSGNNVNWIYSKGSEMVEIDPMMFWVDFELGFLHKSWRDDSGSLKQDYSTYPIPTTPQPLRLSVIYQPTSEGVETGFYFRFKGRFITM
ncbi:hypothetical protein CM49_04347 [Paenibacillus sp. P1XP2]|nr:hypothetical protein CM49_04347 [Paenibacillus sp. P1XP2]